MSRTTKSTLALAREALATGQEVFPAYSHRFSPHRFTQAQLFALLCLKEFLKTDYRGVVQTLQEWSDLREVLGLKLVPHYSTLCYAQERLLKKGRRLAC
jgi:hypothetical protein